MGRAPRVAIEWVDIDAVAEEDLAASRSLSSLELESPALRAAPRRRRDHVAGRIAARRALAALLGTPETGLSVIAARAGVRAGEPVVVDPRGNAAPYAVSISHAAGRAVACAGARSDGPIGVDVEVVVDRAAAFAEEAFGPGELAVWSAALGRPVDTPGVVTAAWVVKEAILKYDGVGLRVPLHSRSIARLQAAQEPLAHNVGRSRWNADLRWWRARDHDGRAFAVGLATDPTRALAVVLGVAPPRRKAM